MSEKPITVKIGDKTYRMRTVGYVPFTRPDLAEKIIADVEKNGEETCRLDVRILAFKEER